MSVMLFGFVVALLTAVLVLCALPQRRRSLTDLPTRIRRLKNLIWQSAGGNLTLRRRLWLVQKAAAMYRGVLDDLSLTFGAVDPQRFSRAVALLGKAEREIASATAHKSRANLSAVRDSVAKAILALHAGARLR